MTQIPSYVMTKHKLIEQIKREGGFLEKVETGPLKNGIYVKTWHFDFIKNGKTKRKTLMEVVITNWHGDKFVSEVSGDAMPSELSGSWYYDASDKLIEPGSVKQVRKKKR